MPRAPTSGPGDSLQPTSKKRRGMTYAPERGWVGLAARFQNHGQTAFTKPRLVTLPGLHRVENALFQGDLYSHPLDRGRPNWIAFQDFERLS